MLDAKTIQTLIGSEPTLFVAAVSAAASMIAAFGASVSAYTAYRTVREMRESRLAQFRPILNVEAGASVEYVYLVEGSKAQAQGGLAERTAPILRVRNDGVAPALQLRCKWGLAEPFDWRRGHSSRFLPKHRPLPYDLASAIESGLGVIPKEPAGIEYFRDGISYGRRNVVPDEREWESYTLKSGESEPLSIPFDLQDELMTDIVFLCAKKGHVAQYLMDITGELECRSPVGENVKTSFRIGVNVSLFEEKFSIKSRRPIGKRLKVTIGTREDYFYTYFSKLPRRLKVVDDFKMFLYRERRQRRRKGKEND